MLNQALAAFILAGMIALVMARQTIAGSDEVAARMSAGNQTYWVEQVVEGLSFPSSMAWLPNGDMLITERMGGLRIVRDGKLDPEPAKGTPPSYQDLFDGLKDIVVDPDYETNQTLYLFMAEGTFDQRHAAVYRARYNANRLDNIVRIFRSEDDFGGYGIIAARMTVLADKTLLIGIPEDHHFGRAQQLGSHIGKILRINRDGSTPKDNPFVNTPGARAEVWSYGHRTPLGLYEDAETGRIWEVEAGERGGDELNVLRAGGNYGWPKAGWGFAYGSGGLAATPLRSSPGIEEPILLWMPSATPSGLTRYRGNAYPLWDGDFFLGHLTNKVLERLRVEGHRVVLQEQMLLDLEERIRDVKVGPDNYLYVLTDHQNGRVLRLQPGRPQAKQVSRVAQKLEQTLRLSSDFPTGGEEEIANLQPGDILKGRQAFLERCASCHSVATIIHGGQIGPDLADVYGSRMGHRAGFDYSMNMAGGVLTWNFSILNRFLADPASLVPGTKMTSPPVTDPEIRRYIIGFLKEQPSH